MKSKTKKAILTTATVAITVAITAVAIVISSHLVEAGRAQLVSYLAFASITGGISVGFIISALIPRLDGSLCYGLAVLIILLLFGVGWW